MDAVAVVDYGGSNLRSVEKALETVARGAHAIEVTSDAAAIARADRVVFPGQGAVGDCMRELAACGLVDAVRTAAREKPFFGICLGLQSLLAFSEEDGGTPCLDLVPGTVRRFPANPGPDARGLPRKIPHMGWNEVHWRREHAVAHGVPDGTRFYFVHSYFVDPEDARATLGETEYIVPFTAALAAGHVVATQFHPEKSAAPGLRLLENFLAWDGGE